MNIIKAIVEPLAGPETLSDANKLGMPYSWYAKGGDKVCKTIQEIKFCLIQTLLMLSYRSLQGRDMLQAKKVYPIIWDMHTAWRENINQEVEDKIIELVDQIHQDKSRVIEEEEAKEFGEMGQIEGTERTPGRTWKVKAGEEEGEGGEGGVIADATAAESVGGGAGGEAKHKAPGEVDPAVKAEAAMAELELSMDLDVDLGGGEEEGSDGESENFDNTVD